MKVPDFVREIEKGRSSAERQDPVTALCAYLAAKRLYPNSTMAKEGIEKSTAQAITF
jgi:hypothetical protein